MTLRLPPRLRSCYHVARSRLRPADRTPPQPHAAHMLLTWRCNLRCGGCNAWQRDVSRELDAAGWRRVFSQLRGLDIVKVIGGEPFTRHDLEEVILSIRKEIDPFIVQLVTNATLTDQVTSFAERAGWPGLHLRVSLDGLEETHDQARGVKGTFSKVMETLEALTDVRKRRFFHLAVNFTLTDRSRPDMDPLIERCGKMGVDVVPGFKVKPFLRTCDVTREKVQTIGVKDRRSALSQLEKSSHGARSGFNLLERAFLQTVNRVVFRKHMAGGEALKFRCRELRNLLYLNPRGEIITCGLNQEPLGSVAERGFDAVWHSPETQAARARVDRCPGCMQGAVEVMSRLYA